MGRIVVADALADNMAAFRIGEGPWRTFAVILGVRGASAAPATKASAGRGVFFTKSTHRVRDSPKAACFMVWIQQSRQSTP